MGLSGCFVLGTFFPLRHKCTSGETISAVEVSAFFMASPWSVVSVAADWFFIQNNLQVGNEFNQHKDMAEWLS